MSSLGPLPPECVESVQRVRRACGESAARARRVVTVHLTVDLIERESEKEREVHLAGC